MPPFSREKARKDVGKKYVNTTLCIGCGVCRDVCPYDAIERQPTPIFDEDMCRGCWACYNRCPEKAIYTKKLRGTGITPAPQTNSGKTCALNGSILLSIRQNSFIAPDIS